MTKKRKGLSQRHENILNCIQEWQKEKGYPPSIREIGSETQISSTSVVAITSTNSKKWAT